MRHLSILLLLATSLIPQSGLAQSPKQKTPTKYDPPANLTPSPEVLEQIQAKTAQLAAKIAELRKDKEAAKLLPDVEIFLRGAQNIVRFKEFYSKDSGKWTLDCLDRGLERSAQLAQGKVSWTKGSGQNVVRGYRSRIDGTAQPYGVTYPLDYGKRLEKAWRADMVLHGRNSNLTEVSFLNSHSGGRKVSPDQDYVQIDIFGRGNNAYRWSGETDVFEVSNSFLVSEVTARKFLPDLTRFVLRGFSMGGAGTWHLGLHYPCLWCVIGPGAGFTTTHGYAPGLPNPLPMYQERCLHIYDAVDYAENAANVPIVAFSGGDDPQKLAADHIEKRLKDLKIDSMTHIVAPGLGHAFPPNWFNKANALWSEHAKKGRDSLPMQISFVTYTTKYGNCSWAQITGLEKHYERSSLKASFTNSGFVIATKNIRALQVTKPNIRFSDAASWIVAIDGQELKADPIEGRFSLPSVFLVRDSGKWKVTNGVDDRLQKTSGLQGPIDDAFSDAFVCVIGSGETWHKATQQHLDAKLKAFEFDWAKHWRGELPTTGDYAVQPNDIMDKNLILFGDPNSNLTLAQIMPKLPFKWTKDEIEFDGKKFKSSDHVPVMIFPNPLNPKKYVVLNTGHTFPSADYNKTNALLFPRLGDYAVLKLAPTMADPAGYEVATAGLFDEYWQFEKR